MRLKFSKEQNEAIYQRLDSELDALKDDQSEFKQTKSGKRILVDLYENIPCVKIRCRGGYVEVLVLKYDKITKKMAGKSVARYILGLEDKSLIIDHINKNPLDNRQKNLRICTPSDNLGNRVMFSKINKYKGYHLTNNGCIRIQCQKEYIRTTITLYSLDEERAALIYDCLAIKIHGEFSELNFPRTNYSDDFVDLILSKLIKDTEVVDRSYRKELNNNMTNK